MGFSQWLVLRGGYLALLSQGVFSWDELEEEEEDRDLSLLLWGRRSPIQPGLSLPRSGFRKGIPSVKKRAFCKPARIGPTILPISVAKQYAFWTEGWDSRYTIETSTLYLKVGNRIRVVKSMAFSKYARKFQIQIKKKIVNLLVTTAINYRKIESHEGTRLFIRNSLWQNLSFNAQGVPVIDAYESVPMV